MYYQIFPDGGLLRLELKANTLARLMENGHLCGADFRCLDCESKQCVQKLCLKNCAKCLLSDCPYQNCNQCNNRKSGLNKPL